MAECSVIAVVDASHTGWGIVAHAVFIYPAPGIRIHEGSDVRSPTYAYVIVTVPCLDQFIFVLMQGHSLILRSLLGLKFPHVWLAVSLPT
jgi:hypothetical protein